MNKKLIGLVHQTIHRRICHGVSSVSYKQFVQLSYLTKSCVITCHILVVANREKHGPSTEYMFFLNYFLINSPNMPSLVYQGLQSSRCTVT